MNATIHPRWEWMLYDDTSQILNALPTPVFTTRFDAEQWLGEHWRSLVDAGAVSGVLMHDGNEITPRVGLDTP